MQRHIRFIETWAGPRRRGRLARNAPLRRTRRGRLLVECAVALVLLAVGSAHLSSVAATVARLNDEAELQDLALRDAVLASAAMAAMPCVVTAGEHTAIVHPRLQVERQVVVAGALRRLRLRAEWRARTLAGGMIREQWSSTAGWCE